MKQIYIFAILMMRLWQFSCVDLEATAPALQGALENLGGLVPIGNWTFWIIICVRNTWIGCHIRSSRHRLLSKLMSMKTSCRSCCSFRNADKYSIAAQMPRKIVYEMLNVVACLATRKYLRACEYPIISTSYGSTIVDPRLQAHR